MLSSTIPTQIRKHFRILPFPRNMYPTHHIARRSQCAKALHRSLSSRKDALNVDAAAYPYPSYAIAVVTLDGPVATAASISDISPEEAEEAAIGLAM